MIDDLTDAYRHRHGRAPDAEARQAIGRQANLMTRQPKKSPRSLHQMRQDWAAQAVAGFGRDILPQIEATASGRAPAADERELEPRSARAVEASRRTVPVEAELMPGSRVREEFVTALAGRVVAGVGEARSTWSVWNLHAAAQRVLRDPGTFTRAAVTEPDPAAVAVLVEEITAAATSAAYSVRLTPAPLVSEPADLRRPVLGQLEGAGPVGGESVFTVHTATRYTSRAVLDAETRLLNAALHTSPGPVLAPRPGAVDAAIAGFQVGSGRVLDPGQAAAVRAFALDPRTVVAGIGPAGTGKTTTMRALHHVLTSTGTGRLIPLATSASSAATLAEELAIPAENLHLFLTLHGLLPDPNNRRADLRSGAEPDPGQARIPAPWRVHPGDVILVDEAGMAGTYNLDRVLVLAERFGARVRLLGDDRQLAAVESGGALRLIATETATVDLDRVHRFADPAEAAATLQLRVGDGAGLDYHQTRERLHGGDRDAMTEAAYTGWLTDVRAGKTSLLITSSNVDVATLSARARTDRVAAGQVEPDGVRLGDGNQAGRGDWIVTRLNDRTLRSGSGRVWVRNGDTWTVTARHDDGSLAVRHHATGVALTLPTAYVAAYVQLAYASTVHRVQGATVDTAHALISPGMSREEFYVALTRAIEGTHVWVITHENQVDGEDAIDQHRWDPTARTARSVAEQILGREAAEPAATTALHEGAERELSMAVVVPRYQRALTALTSPYYQQAITATLGERATGVLARDEESWANLLAALRRAHQAGWQPGRALAHATRELPLHEHDLSTPGTGSGPVRAAGHPTSDAQAEGRGGDTLVFRLTRTLESLTHQQSAPPALDQPDGDDLHRYAQLLTGRDVTGLPPGPGALARPAVLTPAALLRPDAPSVGPAYESLLARTLTPRLAHRITSDPAWSDACTTLDRARLHGHDPADLITAAARGSRLRHAAHPAQDLAVLLREHLTTVPDPDLNDPTSPAGRATTWQLIAWTLKAHENRGGRAEDLLPTPGQFSADADGLTGGRARLERLTRLPDTYQHIQTTLRHRAEHHSATSALPWVSAPQPETTATPAHQDYLAGLHATIGDRLATLTVQLTRQAAGPDARTGRGDELPAWTQALGHPGAAPTGPVMSSDPHQQSSRWAEWFTQAAVVAAHREHHDITTDHTQPLGPFPTRADPPAYADSYWAAATAALNATRNASHPRHERHDPHLPSDRETRLTDKEFTLLHALTTSTYTHLTRPEQDAVATTMLARLGHLTPEPATPADGASDRAQRHGDIDVDAAVLHPTNTRHLHHALTIHGHHATTPAASTPERRPGLSGNRDTRNPNEGPSPAERRRPTTKKPAPRPPRPAPKPLRRATPPPLPQPAPPRPPAPKPQAPYPHPRREGPTIGPR